MDDTFFVWNHGEEELENHFGHITSINSTIQFKMEKEKAGQLLFLDVLVMKEGISLAVSENLQEATRTELSVLKILITIEEKTGGQWAPVGWTLRLCHHQFL